MYTFQSLYQFILLISINSVMDFTFNVLFSFFKSITSYRLNNVRFFVRFNLQLCKEILCELFASLIGKLISLTCLFLVDHLISFPVYKEDTCKISLNKIILTFNLLLNVPIHLSSISLKKLYRDSREFF